MEKPTINGILRAVMIALLLSAVFTFGQYNANYLEEKIKDYCSEQINFSVNQFGYSAVLWKNPSVQLLVNGTGDEVNP